MRARRTIGDESPLNPHTPCRAARCPPFLPTARRGLGHGRPVSAPRRGMGMPRGGAMGGVTPRQACPRPSGLRRNLRSKTRWFTGFCNSHQVSHFATFFIDARAEISVAESRLKDSQTGGGSPPRCCIPGRGVLAPGEAAALSAFDSLALAAPVGLLGARRDARPRVVPRAARRERRFRGTGSPVVVLEATMILPQVHLRKPCYDFSFL